jgi:hypothetical protein
LLDVWRVEQRLRYFAFPAYQRGSGINIKDFMVDGNFDQDEKAALKLFEKIVRFRVPGEPGYSESSKDPTSVGNNKYADDVNGADGAISPSEPPVIPGNETSGSSLNWLNAYNAPHWMNIGYQMEFNNTATRQPGYSLPGWQNGDSGGERYGVSWMRDLMRAQAFSDPGYLSGLPKTGARFTAGIDGNGSNPGGHKSHWLGMNFDLSLQPYLDAHYMTSAAAILPLSIDISNLPGPLPAKENDWAWSNADALALVEQLRNQEDGSGRNFMGRCFAQLPRALLGNAARGIARGTRLAQSAGNKRRVSPECAIRRRLPPGKPDRPCHYWRQQACRGKASTHEGNHRSAWTCRVEELPCLASPSSFPH